MIVAQASSGDRGVNGWIRGAAWRSAAVLAAVTSLSMFAGALFLFVSERIDTIAAFVAVGSLFAMFAIASSFVARSRVSVTAEAGRRPTSVAAWLEPSIIAAGLDVARTIGGRRAAALMLGAITAFWLLSKSQNPTAGS